jgi:hypothetical protein
MKGNAAEILLIIVAVVGLVVCLITGPWAYRIWATRSLYLKDFERLFIQARKLSQKTMEVMDDVARDNTAAECIKATNQELVNTADEWDNGIRTALAAWGDFIEMQRAGYYDYLVDLETQQKRDVDHLAKQRKNHAKFMIKFMIKFMRAKVLEGINQREKISVQLQRIHVAVKTRLVTPKSLRNKNHPNTWLTQCRVGVINGKLRGQIGIWLMGAKFKS